MPNLELLAEMVEWVEEQEQLPKSEREWDQETFGMETPCGTVYCVAGKVAAEAGWHPTLISGERIYSTLSPRPGESFGSRPDHDFSDDVAAEILGLTTESQYRLFNVTNTASDIRRIAEEIAGQPLVSMREREVQNA